MPGAGTENGSHSVAQYTLRSLTRLATRYPVLVLVLAVGLAGAATVYTQACLKFKTSRADLIDPKADYHKRWVKYTQAFGDSADDMVVVVEADSPEKIKAVIEDLGTRLEKESGLFTNILYKVDPSQLRQKGLQYLSPEQLRAILEHLEEFGPLLKGRWNLLTLSSIYRDLRHKLSRTESLLESESANMAEPLLHQTALLTSSMAHFVRDPEDYQSPWPEVVPLDAGQHEEAAQVRYFLNEKESMGFLKVQSVDKTESFDGSSKSIDRLREVIEEGEKRHPGVHLGLTGIPVLESDEMRDSQLSMFAASVLSFVGVAALLVLGFRGIRYPVLSMVLLVIGMAWSFGFTTLAVGHLNILSVSFAAMLIGLGTDFAIVYIARYLQLRHEGHEMCEALVETAGGVGPGILTAAITGSVAFFAAILTAFAGIAELGIIAGGGIMLCVFATFTVLPAMLVLTDKHLNIQRIPKPYEGKTLKSLTSQFPWPVLVGCGGLVLFLGITYGFRVKYDYNLLNLQAHGLKSVEVQTKIFDQTEHSLLFAVSLADGPQQALELKRKFEALPTVHHVDEIASMVPPYPEEETQLLVQAIHTLLAQLPDKIPEPGEIDPSTVGNQIEEMEHQLKGMKSQTAALALGNIDQLLENMNHLSLRKQIEFLQNYQRKITGELLAQLKLMASAANPEPLRVADLPTALASRFVSRGKWLLQIYPKNQVWDREPLEAFVADIRSVDPEVTGTPLQTFEATREIKQSYVNAAMYALVAVCCVLLLDFRSLSHSLLALLPPLAGMVLTFGIMGLLHEDLNPANLIVLPLILGIGVDGGVHLMHDYRAQLPHKFELPPSTANALILNSFTTIVGFGAMMIARHRGLYSLGLVLSVGVASCLFVAMIILPAILTLLSRLRPQSEPESESRTLGLLPVSTTASTTTFPQAPHAGARMDAVSFKLRAAAPSVIPGRAMGPGHNGPVID